MLHLCSNKCVELIRSAVEAQNKWLIVAFGLEIAMSFPIGPPKTSEASYGSA
jgi:hypothetical protein